MVNDPAPAAGWRLLAEAGDADETLRGSFIEAVNRPETTPG